MSDQPLKVFISYAHKDEPLKKQLRSHLRAMERANRIVVWDDRAIDAGANWERAILDQLAEADILLLLISAAFIDSDYCYGEEMAKALERHLAGEARIVPVLLAPCQWQLLPLLAEHRVQMIPRDGRPVFGTQDWPSTDSALEVVAGELLKVVDATLRVRRQGG